jgi:broad specificity phosphatase PhoE
MPDPTILLIRHAITKLNEQKRIRAWSDVDIDPGKGRDDTLKTAARLQNLPISEIVTSDLTRAEQTGQILANQLFVPTSSDRNLRPWNLGKFEGSKFDEVKDDMNHYIEHPNKEVPGGEKFNDFLARWQEGLQGLVSKAMNSDTGVIAGVTHSRNIEATRYMLSGSKDTEALVKANTVPPSGVMALQVSNGAIHEVPFANEHLEKES